MSASAPVRLIPLICPGCQSPLPAKVEERAWLCDTCQRGLLLATDGTLCAQEIFFSNQMKPGWPGRPFWVSLGQVTISERSVYLKATAAKKRPVLGHAAPVLHPSYRGQPGRGGERWASACCAARCSWSLARHARSCR
jgi:hypothetical protein